MDSKEICMSGFCYDLKTTTFAVESPNFQIFQVLSLLHFQKEVQSSKDPNFTFEPVFTQKSI